MLLFIENLPALWRSGENAQRKVLVQSDGKLWYDSYMLKVRSGIAKSSLAEANSDA